MKKFKIIYMNGSKVLGTENRTHTTGREPSGLMIRTALHTLCLDNGIENDFTKAKAELFEDGKLITTYTIGRK